MGILGKQKKNSAEKSSTVQPEVVQDLGVVFHVMPKDFLGAEATLQKKPQAEPVAAALAAVPVLPKAVPVQTPPLVPVGPKKKKTPFWVWILIFVLVLFIGAAVAYVVLLKAQTQPTEVVEAPVATLPVVTTPPVVEVPVTPTVPEKPVPSKDSDSDGLTDIEERMYGTDYRNPDTDGDTFLDGNEVFHRYDPMGVAPSTLLDTGAVDVYTSESGVFSLYYPKSWKATASPTQQSVTFQTPNIASIIVAWSPKDADLTVEDWILTNVPKIDLSSLQASYTKEGYYTLRSKDDLIAYIDLGTDVYVMTYDLATSLEISYIQTFAMMVNSLVVLP